MLFFRIGAFREEGEESWREGWVECQPQIKVPGININSYNSINSSSFQQFLFIYQQFVEYLINSLYLKVLINSIK